MRWLRSSADTTSWPRLVGMAVALASLAAFASDRVGMTLIGAFAIGNIWYLSTRRYKKPLVMTPRARRIYSVSAIISIAITAVAAVAADGHSWLLLKLLRPRWRYTDPVLRLAHRDHGRSVAASAA